MQKATPPSDAVLDAAEPRSEKSWIRGRIHEVVSSLHRLDGELAGLAESLPLPLDATEMWESRLPPSFPTHLYSAIDAVRTDCIHDAIDTLVQAARQSDLSLRRRFLRELTPHGETREG
jgi:hypothetical protein